MQIVFIRDNLCEMSNPFSFEKTILIHVFPRKQDLTFHANQKISLDISCKLPTLETICMKCQTSLLEKLSSLQLT